MWRWIESCALRCVSSPEKLAEDGLRELRLELFQAEQRVLDAQMHAAYYRMRLAFFDDVIAKGIEQVADQRRGQREMPEALRTGSRLTDAGGKDASLTRLRASD
jgi:hypothetical protein